MYVWCMCEHSMPWHMCRSALFFDLYVSSKDWTQLSKRALWVPYLMSPLLLPFQSLSPKTNKQPPPQKKTWGWRWLSLPPQLRAFTSIPSTQIKWFSTTYKSSFGRPDTLSGLLRYQHTHGTHTHICIMTPSLAFLGTCTHTAHIHMHNDTPFWPS